MYASGYDDFLLILSCYAALSRTWFTRRGNFHTFSITTLALSSKYHSSLPHRHEPSSLASSTLLRLGAWSWFRTFTCSTCCCSVVFNCLIYGVENTFFVPITASLKSISSFTVKSSLWFWGFFLDLCPWPANASPKRSSKIDSNPPMFWFLPALKSKPPFE